MIKSKTKTANSRFETLRFGISRLFPDFADHAVRLAKAGYLEFEFASCEGF